MEYGWLYKPLPLDGAGHFICYYGLLHLLLTITAAVKTDGFITTCYYIVIVMDSLLRSNYLLLRSITVVMDPLQPVTTVVMGLLLLIT